MSETVPIDTSDRSYGATALSELRGSNGFGRSRVRRTRDRPGEMMVGGVANLHWKRFQSRSGLDFVEDREISPAHTTHENSCHENFFTDMCVHGRAKQSRIYIYIMP